MTKRMGINSPNFYLTEVYKGHTLDGVSFKNTFLGVGSGYTPGKALASAYCESEERITLASREYILEESKLFAEVDSQRFDHIAWKPFLFEDADVESYISYDNRLGELRLVKALNLGSRETCYIPEELVFFQRRDNNLCFYPPIDSTGTASHIDVNKAASSAALEVIEKNALIVFYTSHVAIDVTLRCEASSSLEGTLRLFSSFGLRPTILDISITSGIYCYLVVTKTGSKTPYFSVGAGCELNPLEACRRALLECLQIFFSYNTYTQSLTESELSSPISIENWDLSLSYVRSSTAAAYHRHFLEPQFSQQFVNQESQITTLPFWELICSKYNDVYLYKYNRRNSRRLKEVKVIIPSLFWSLPTEVYPTPTARSGMQNFVNANFTGNRIPSIPFP